jgi:cytidyltransferase-like protein
MSNGFLLGKFMPPHGGHVLLAQTAQALVDRLTILVCWLPDDPIPGPLRLQWMRELFPDARVIGHDAIVPQVPGEHPDFWGSGAISSVRRIPNRSIGCSHPSPTARASRLKSARAS